MNYSYFHEYYATHLNFYHDINRKDVLDHPEKYLGPNYKEVLNYWFYWDSLSYAQRDVFIKRYWALGNETIDKAHEISRELASEVIGPECVTSLDINFLELIAAHLYIERDIPFTFLPLIFDL